MSKKQTTNKADAMKQKLLDHVWEVLCAGALEEKHPDHEEGTSQIYSRLVTALWKTAGIESDDNADFAAFMNKTFKLGGEPKAYRFDLTLDAINRKKILENVTDSCLDDAVKVAITKALKS